MPPRATNPHHHTFLCIQAYFRQKQQAPTFEEIAEITGSPIGTINRHVMLLDIQGYITRTPRIRRGITLTGKELEQQNPADHPRSMRQQAQKKAQKPVDWKVKLPRMSPAQQAARIEMVVKKALSAQRSAVGSESGIDPLHDYRGRLHHTLKAHKI